MRVFIAGPYGDDNPDHVIAAHVAQADEAAKQLVLAGHYPFCPHKMTHGWQKDSRLRREDWIRVDLDFLQHWAEAVLRLPGESAGADHEVALARYYRLRVYHRVEDVGQAGGDNEVLPSRVLGGASIMALERHQQKHRMRRPALVRQSGPYIVKSHSDGSLRIYPNWSQFPLYNALDGGGPGLVMRIALASDLERWLNASQPGGDGNGA